MADAINYRFRYRRFRAQSRHDVTITQMTEVGSRPGIALSSEQFRASRARSIAIAAALGALVILFYIVTLVKGPGVLMRPM